MMLSVEGAIFRDLSHRERVRKIKEAGFDAVDFSLMGLRGENAELLGDNYVERARELRSYMDGIGISCSQAHAPFDMKEGEPFSVEFGKYLRLVRSIEVAAILGAPYIVVHCVKTADPADIKEYNRAFYLSLLPYAERAGIKISVENLFYPPDESGRCAGILDDPAEHMEFVRSLGSPHFNICLDLGHSGVAGRAPEDVIRAMDPDLLELLHVHDNDCKSDMHVFPFSGKFNWPAICAALAEIGYRGCLSLELIGQFRSTPERAQDAALAYAAAVGRELISAISGAEI